MFTCNRCKKKKKLSEYNYKSKEKGTYQRICKECTRSQIRNHYRQNREYYIEKARSRNKRIRTRIRKYIWQYLLKHPCIDCGENDPIVLEFDHQYGKKLNISHAANQNLSIFKLEKEISKCEVRCANCHRRKTAHELGWYKEE